MKVYCIGIGGIGLSALARYYAHEGAVVSGSDTADSKLIETLRAEGMDIAIGHDPSRITQDIDLVIYTIAISPDDEELARAKELGRECKTYAEALGAITAKKTTIAICGTHGKTTTTAMMYYALKACGVNPTVIIGSLLTEGGTNFIAGDGEYMVVEACEYKRSFLSLHPTHVVVTNIDDDHLDYYKDSKDILDAFQSFAQSVPENGYVVTHSDVSLATKGAQIHADNVAVDITLAVPGEHNKRNAQLVIALLEKLGFLALEIRKGLASFPGTWRRMEYKGVTENGVVVYDDYGHHPREIVATLQALREKYPAGEYRLHLFFQPHLHSRTKHFFSEFVDALSGADYIYVLPIYRARSEEDFGVSAEVVAQALRDKGSKATSVESIEDLPAIVGSLSGVGLVAINMGAGDAFAELDKVRFV